MGEALQLDAYAAAAGADGLDVGDPRLVTASAPRKIVDQGYSVEYEVKTDAPSLLVLSRKFHRDWRAFALVSGAWTPGQTREVNGIFLGAQVPADAERVRFVFRPWARYAWIAHAFWLILIPVVAFDIGRRRRGRADADANHA